MPAQAAPEEEHPCDQAPVPTGIQQAPAAAAPQRCPAHGGRVHAELCIPSSPLWHKLGWRKSEESHIDTGHYRGATD